MWERSCVGCDTPGPRVCAACAAWDRGPRRTTAPAFVSEAWTLEPYASGLGRVITRSKGAPDRALALQVARVLARRACADPHTASLLYTATCVSWIPSPWTRRLRRGFALSAILATELAAVSTAPVTRLLSLSPGARQATAGRTARARNLRGRVRTVDKPVQGTILLVDDVLTTGATASRCAEELLGAGADRVNLITVCRAMNADDRETPHDVRIL